MKIMPDMTARQYFDQSAEQFQIEAMKTEGTAVNFLVAGRCLGFVFASDRKRVV